MDTFVTWLLENIKQNGLTAVFTGSLLEEMIAPIPSPAVMMGAGAILLEKYGSVSLPFILELCKIALIGGLGALVGSYFIYALGYFGGKPIVEKTKRFTGIKWSSIEKFQKKLENSKSDEFTIAALRSIPVMPAVVISITCGLLRVNILSYSISFYIGGFIRNVVFLVIGWSIGEAFRSSAKGFDSIQNIITVLIAVVLVGVLGYLYWRRSKEEKEDETLDAA